MSASSDYSIFFDVVIVALLVAAIAYCMLLSRRLAVLRDTKAEMARMIADFSAATGKAEQGLESFKSLAAQSGEELQSRVGQADQLRKDLAFLVDKAEGACDRLEASIARSRPHSVAGQTKGPRPVEGGGTGARAAGPSGAAALAAVAPRPRPEAASAGVEAARKLSPSQAGLLKALQGLR